MKNELYSENVRRQRSCVISFSFERHICVLTKNMVEFHRFGGSLRGPNHLIGRRILGVISGTKLGMGKLVEPRVSHNGDAAAKHQSVKKLLSFGAHLLDLIRQEYYLPLPNLCRDGAGCDQLTHVQGRCLLGRKRVFTFEMGENFSRLAPPDSGTTLCSATPVPMELSRLLLGS